MVYGGKIWSKKCKIWHWKKSTVRVFFGPIFVFLCRKVTYRDLSKNRPHKKHCAWARTPPWENDEIYRKLCFFNDFGVFNRAGKTVSKIGIYALPPLKSDFYGIFIYWGVTFRVFSISCLSCMWRIVFSSPFFGIQYNAIL
jgi:hypothetical protein